MKTIFCDMDGVLVDLDTAMVSMFPGVDIFTDRNEYFRLLTPFVENRGFENAPKLNRSDELTGFLWDLYLINDEVDVQVLTSHGSFYFIDGIPHPEVVVAQKKQWLMQNMMTMHLLKFNPTPSGAAKARFANKDSFLIDDHEDNIKKFVEAGGSGFLYTPDRLEDLKLSIGNFLQSKT